MITEGGPEHGTGFSGNRLLVAPTMLEFVDEPSLDVVPHRSTASEFQVARRLAQAKKRNRKILGSLADEGARALQPILCKSSEHPVLLHPWS